MVAEGWAVAYRRYSMDYVKQEDQAKSVRRGIWAGRFAMPWDWRRGERSIERQAPGDRPAAGCTIKGNIGSQGERIYHVEGGRFYGRTKIDPSRGERWFCTEAEAPAAGWRKSQQ